MKYLIVSLLLLIPVVARGSDPTSIERCVNGKVYIWDGAVWRIKLDMVANVELPCVNLPAPQITKFDQEFEAYKKVAKPSNDVIVVDLSKEPDTTTIKRDLKSVQNMLFWSVILVFILGIFTFIVLISIAKELDKIYVSLGNIDEELDEMDKFLYKDEKCPTNEPNSTTAGS